METTHTFIHSYKDILIILIHANVKTMSLVLNGDWNDFCYEWHLMLLKAINDETNDYNTEYMYVSLRKDEIHHKNVLEKMSYNALYLFFV